MLTPEQIAEALRLRWLRLKAALAPKPKRTIYWHEMSPEQQQAFNKAFATMGDAFAELDKAFETEPRP